MASELKDLRCKKDDVLGYVQYMCLLSLIVSSSSYRTESPPIRIVVGKPGKERTFYVHEASIKSRSSFFEKASSGEWEEAQERRVALKEDDPETFKAYLHWVYTGKIASSAPGTGLVEYRPLMQLYALAERLLDTELRDRLVEAIVAMSRERHPQAKNRNFPGPSEIKIVYENTPESSPLRRLLVDMYVARGTQHFEISATNGVDFLVDVTKALLAERTISEETRKQKFAEIDEGSPCSYHHHDKDKPCGGKPV